MNKHSEGPGKGGLPEPGGQEGPRATYMQTGCATHAHPALPQHFRRADRQPPMLLHTVPHLASLPTQPFPYQIAGGPGVRGWTPRPGRATPSSGARGCSGTDWDLHPGETIRPVGYFSLGLDAAHTQPHLRCPLQLQGPEVSQAPFSATWEHQAPRVPRSAALVSQQTPRP